MIHIQVLPRVVWFAAMGFPFASVCARVSFGSAVPRFDWEDAAFCCAAGSFALAPLLRFPTSSSPRGPEGAAAPPFAEPCCVPCAPLPLLLFAPWPARVVPLFTGLLLLFGCVATEVLLLEPPGLVLLAGV